MLKQFDFNLRTTKQCCLILSWQKFGKQSKLNYVREGGDTKGLYQIKKGILVARVGKGKRKGYKIVYTTRIIIIKMSQHKFSMFIVRLVIYCLMKQIKKKKNFVAFLT